MISYFLCQHSLTCFPSKDTNLLVESLRNQFLSFFFRFCYLFLLIPNFLFFCYLLYFHHSFPLLFFLLLLLFSLFSFFFFSFFFCFYYPNFPCFGFHYFPHSFEHLFIFTSSVLQLISELWQASHSIPKIIFHFYLLISILSLCPW